MRIFLSLILVLAVGSLGFTAYSTYMYRTPLEYADQTMVIPPRTGGREVIAQLHAAGLVPALPVIALPFVMSQQYASLKAGEYHFEPGLSPAQIIGKIARGEIVVHQVTVPEGWTSYQIYFALMNEPLLTGSLPKIAEGSVYPDTMRFSRDEPRAAVLARMQKAQTDYLARAWAKRDPAVALSSPEQALILASVVEKETGVAGERAKIAGVFFNRLRLGMKLQSDPTVVYGIERMQGGAPMKRELSRNDLARDTLYNSYTREGLPPTPICHPGRAAIEAVLHPEATDALYFVATGRGGHNFAASLNEHEKNVATYRQQLKADSAKNN